MPKELADALVRRSEQREALRFSAGAWKDEDHPELALGSAPYVDELRSEPDERYEDTLLRQTN